MKKTAISLILALAMILGFVLVAAPQAEAAGTNHVAHTEGMNHCACGGTAQGIGDHTACTSVTGAWIDLNAYVADSANVDSSVKFIGSEGVVALASGNYYLSGNLKLTMPAYAKEGAIITICLNGYDIEGPDGAGEAGRCFACGGTEATFNLCDCQGGGQISSKATCNGGVMTVGEGRRAVINLYSGTYIGSQASTSPGSAFRFMAGVIRMYNAVIKDGVNHGQIVAAQAGGNVCVSKTAEMTMYGGIIENGTADKGSNVYLMDSAKLTIYGGTITGGKNSEDIMAISASTVKVINLTGTTTLTTSGGGATLDFTELDPSVTMTQNQQAVTLVGTGTTTPDPTEEPTEEPTQEPTEAPAPQPGADAPADPTLWIVIGVAAVVIVAAVVVVVIKKKKT